MPTRTPVALALAGLVAASVCGLFGSAAALGQSPAGSAADWEALKRKLTQPGGAPPPDLLEPSESDPYALSPAGTEVPDEGLARPDDLAGPGSSPVPVGTLSGLPGWNHPPANESAKGPTWEETGVRPDRGGWEGDASGVVGAEDPRDVETRLLDAGADAESVERVHRGDVDEELILRLEDEGIGRDMTDELRGGMYAPAELPDTPRTDSPQPE